MHKHHINAGPLGLMPISGNAAHLLTRLLLAYVGAVYRYQALISVEISRLSDTLQDKCESDISLKYEKFLRHVPYY